MELDGVCFDSGRVLVIGDVILDRYMSGSVKRISPEAPVPVLDFDGEYKTALGGAGNVAANVVALGGQCTLLSIAGTDQYGGILAQLLEASGICDCVRYVAAATTTCKTRIVSEGQTLIRIDEEKALTAEIVKSVLKISEDLIKQSDVIIFSDYNKGINHIVKQIIQKCRKHKKPILIDPKSTDFSVYRRADLIKPNFSEFSKVVGSFEEAEFTSLALDLMKRIEVNNLLVTRSEKGMTLFNIEAQELHFPAETKEVFDVTGAGDTVIATIATMLAAGIEMEQAVRLGNLAAGLAVGQAGTVPISKLDLLKVFVEKEPTAKVVTEDALKVLLSFAKQKERTIVFTNGCFDILHEGHVRYLDAAAKLGSILIVGLNDDESVRRLKGENRPINPLSSRASVLAHLEVVDYVVPFSADTPVSLIEQVRPDILVKGADYAIEEIAGADFILAQGGRVETVPLVDGVSSSGIIDKIIKKH